MTWQEALDRLRAAQAGVIPPGGFDAWLHVLAVPVRGGPPGQRPEERDGGQGTGVQGAAAAPEGVRGPAPPAGRVRVETLSLTAPNDPQRPLALFFISPAHAGQLLARQLDHLAAECHRGRGADGFLVQVGLSGMAYRALADPPPGFVPRYRLPRRTGEEPVWAGEEPVWCPCPQLAQASRQLAEDLIARLASRLGGGS